MNESDFIPQTAKRTKPIVWATVLLGWMSVAGIYMFIAGGGSYLSFWFTPICIAAALALLAFPRSPRTYTITVVALACFVLRAAYTTVVEAYGLLSHRATHDGWPLLIATAWVCFLVFLLFRAYTFGAPSRQFYGFPATPNRSS